MSKNRTPTIAVDTWALRTHARNHGVHLYTEKLLTYFRSAAVQHGIEIVPFRSAEVANDANAFSGAPGFRPTDTPWLQHDRAWRWGAACAVAARENADLFFIPHSVTLFAFQRTAVTIHDVIPLVMPWPSMKRLSSLRLCLWVAAHFSQAIITVSEYSRKQIVNVFQVPESKVHVIYNGYDRSRFNLEPAHPEKLAEAKCRFGISKPFIFHYGVIKPNKNVKRLIEAYREMMEKNRNLDFELVIAGNLGWDFQDVLVAAHASNGRGKIILTGGIDDSDLVSLLKGASLVVIPSLCEGFCLPLIESMACGVPTIASNSSCLPEVSGGVLCYFDPTSVEDMAACMERALEDESLRGELSCRGVQRASDFGWERCGQQTLELLARMAHEV